MKAITYKLYDEIEFQTIYTGVEQVDGEWICTTGGDPITRAACEDADAYDLIEQIERIISGDTSGCERCDVREANEEDIAYVNDILEAWGIR